RGAPGPCRIPRSRAGAEAPRRPQHGRRRPTPPLLPFGGRAGPAELPEGRAPGGCGWRGALPPPPHAALAASQALAPPPRPAPGPRPPWTRGGAGGRARAGRRAARRPDLWPREAVWGFRGPGVPASLLPLFGSLTVSSESSAQSRAGAASLSPVFPTQNGKVAIVTGGAKGIGYQTVKHLARLGMHVIIAGNSERDGQEAVRKIKEETLTGKVEFLYCDLASMKSIRQFVQQFRAKNCPLHVLVNNDVRIHPMEPMLKANLPLCYLPIDYSIF
uniref:Zinc finger BED-type containing 1 n=1 Tax=Taeniopygia guttata TaxID=59729 RepID=H0ZKF4_TAEGU